MIPSLLLFAQTPLSAPQTPPERLLSAYLRAYNEREGAGLADFLRDNFELPRNRPELLKEIVGVQTRGRRSSGELELRAVRSQGAARIVADARSRRLGTWSRLSLYLAAEAPAYEKPTLPYRIAGMGMAGEAAPEGLLPRAGLRDWAVQGRARG